jgi:hypothetical protein
MDFYVYVLLDPMRPGLFQYGDMTFSFEPFYVGKGCGLRARAHYSEKNRKGHKLNRVQIIKAAGLRPIPLKMFTGLAEDAALFIEQQITKTIGRRNDGTGPLTNYTIGGGGLTGWKHSEETKAKLRKPKSPEGRANIAAALKRRPPPTEEQRQKIRAALKGRPLSEETKQKMKGRVPWNKGKSPSAETRAKIADALRGQSSWNKGVPMRPETYARCSATMFKPGLVPHNKSHQT